MNISYLKSIQIRNPSKILLIRTFSLILHKGFVQQFSLKYTHMENPPLISIITITYNAAKELQPTMQSVAQQTWKDFEHIIIDGASTDNTLEVAKQCHTPNLRIISEPDKGLYDAMNKGLNNSKGKYVLFLNAGDTFHNADVLLKYAYACKNNADIIFADTIIVDASRRLIGPRHLTAPEKLSFQSFSEGMLICHQAFMVKKSLTPPYDTTYRFSADYDWTVKCIQKTQPDRCVNLNMIAIDYLADGTTDKNKWKSLIERFKIMCKHYGVIKTVGRHLAFIPRVIKRKSL